MVIQPFALMRTPPQLIRYYYGFFSFIPSSLNPNPPKIILADEATKVCFPLHLSSFVSISILVTFAAALILYQMLHGEKCLDSIRNTAASLFAGSDDVAVESLPRFRSVVICCLSLNKHIFLAFF